MDIEEDEFLHALVYNLRGATKWLNEGDYATNEAFDDAVNRQVSDYRNGL